MHKRARERVWLSDVGTVHVNDLIIDRRDVHAYLERSAEPDKARLLIEIIETGVYCLERATQVQGMDFMRQQTELAIAEMAKTPSRIEQELRKLVGTKDGQLLAPVNAAMEAMKERIAVVEKFFDQKVDPRRPDNPLGQAIKSMLMLLDAKREDSVQQALARAVKSVAGDEGQLAAAMKKVVTGVVKPLHDEIDRLRREIVKQDAADQALAKTTAKGVTFELELLPVVQSWARFVGGSVKHVGGDHESGDILVTISDHSLPVDEFSIVIEARDDITARGRKRITDDISRAMKLRGAHYGLYVGKTQAALALEIGDWFEGGCTHGPFVACTASNLVIALRFVLVDARLRAMAAARPEADSAAISADIRRIRTALRRIRTIRLKAGDIHKGADSVSQEAEELHREISDALASVESALHVAATAAA